MAIDLVKVNGCLLSAIRMTGATRRLLKECGLTLPNMQRIEASLRETACEVQAEITAAKEDGDRPLLDGET